MPTLKLKLTNQLRVHLRKRDVPSKVVPGLARRCFGDCESVTLGLLSTEGFSSSVLLSAHGRQKEGGLPFQPQVLKVDRQDRIKGEYSRFKEHVSNVLWGVPSQTRPPKTYRGWAALPYWLIGGHFRVRSLRDFYAEESPETIVALWETLFNQIMAPWLCQFSSAHRNVFRDSDCYSIPSKDLEHILQIIQKIGGPAASVDIKAGWDGLRKSDKHLAWVYMCIVHGDLNSGNVLIDDGIKPWLIDFAHTGPGHYLRDLAKLEAEIKFLLMDRLGDRSRIASWLDLDRVLDDGWPFGQKPPSVYHGGNGDSELTKAFVSICGLRALAKDRMIGPKGPQVAQYRAALLHFTLRVLAFKDVSLAKKEYAVQSARRLLQFRYDFAKPAVLSGRQLAPRPSSPSEPPTHTHRAFLFTLGTYSFSRSSGYEASERYCGVCACLFENSEYNQMQESLKQAPVDNFAAASISPSVKDAQFSLIGVVVDKLSLYLADPNTDFCSAALSGIFTRICESLLSRLPRPGSVVVYAPQRPERQIRAAFEQIMAQGDGIRQTQLFRASLVGLHFEDEKQWPGLELAQTLAPYVTASILRDHVAEDAYSSWLECPSTEHAKTVEARWLRNQFIDAQCGKALIV
jgi:hypothetical protein